MLKKLLLVFFLLILQIPAIPYTLKAGISYSVEEARIESFKNIPLSIKMDIYEPYRIDANFKTNIKIMSKGKDNYKNRYLTLFSDNKYAIRYKKNLNISYYYTETGSLYAVELDINKKYPIKSVKYDINGKLDSVSINTSSKEQFVFDSDKKLISHWIGNNCYNENGELIGTRQ